MSSQSLSGQPGPLWAITSFFNPSGYHRRLVNYRRFRAELRVPLATIELGFNGNFELADQDADQLVRVTDGDVMWQKERLLNLLVNQLPPECQYVAWIDSDVLLQDPRWPQRAVEQLATVSVVQLFSKLRDLGPDEDLHVDIRCIPSVSAAVLGGRPVSDALLRRPASTHAPVAHGMAWAARRELLARNGFYDGCVIGGGDTALLCAAYGIPEAIMGLWGMSAAQRDHYSRWAIGFRDDVKGEVSALTGEIHHLWHGELKDRRYLQRQNDLMAHRFDPYTDIRPGADGAWRWASDKPALHTLLRAYFDNRHEDGNSNS